MTFEISTITRDSEISCRDPLMTTSNMLLGGLYVIAYILASLEILLVSAPWLGVPGGSGYYVAALGAVAWVRAWQIAKLPAVLLYPVGFLVALSLGWLSVR